MGMSGLNPESSESFWTYIYLQQTKCRVQIMKHRSCTLPKTRNYKPFAWEMCLVIYWINLCKKVVKACQ